MMDTEIGTVQLLIGISTKLSLSSKLKIHLPLHSTSYLLTHIHYMLRHSPLSASPATTLAASTGIPYQTNHKPSPSALQAHEVRFLHPLNSCISPPLCGPGISFRVHSPASPHKFTCPAPRSICQVYHFSPLRPHRPSPFSSRHHPMIII